MTDMSLFYESDVTIPSVYGTPMTSGTVTVDAETSTQTEIDRRRTAWMVAAQAGDRAAYETLLRDCIPFITRVARGQGIRSDLIDDLSHHYREIGIKAVAAAAQKDSNAPQRSGRSMPAQRQGEKRNRTTEDTNE
jgi:hypothetical protein